MSEFDPTSLWRGVYDSFAEVPRTEAAYDSDTWLAHQIDRARKLAAAADKARPGDVSPCADAGEYILASVVATLLGEQESVRVVDFGGGLGGEYHDLRARLAGHGDRVHFQVVERPAVVCAAQDNALASDRLRFVADMADVEKPVDIVHAASSLQYVEDWAGMLGSFAATGASRIILAEAPAGDLPRTFATGQHYYGRTIPCWFFRIDDLTARCADLGYRLAYNAGFRRKYLGEHLIPPMAALPAGMRLERFCQLMFTRSAS